MASTSVRRLLKYSIIGGVTAGTLLSLHTNKYQIDSIGIVRLSRAAYTVFNIAWVYKRELYSRQLDKSSEEYRKIKSLCHQQGAERLLKLCCSNKGVYVKVGQHIAALDYLIPKEYVQTMKILHSHAPSSDLEDIYQVIKEDLKRDLKDLFVSIDPEPIGSASLAQVHKATLQDGSVVAVKVQHPYILGNARVDLKTMEYLVKIVGWIFPEFKFQWLVDETKKNLPRELNFECEGQNAEKVIKMFKNLSWLRVPKVRWNMTTKRVLTMEFVDGGQVNDLNYMKENNIDPFEVSDKLGQLYSEMIFTHGFVHSDPHPGNILVKKAPDNTCDIILLDHGLYATLDKNVMVNYAQLWLSILNRDRNGMRKHTKNLGIEGNLYGLLICMITGRPWEAILEGVDRKKQTITEKEFFQDHIPTILPQITDVLDRVNHQLILIFKTNDLMRGIEHTLQTSSRMTSFKVMSHCCVCSVYTEKINACESRFNRLKYRIAKYWALFKLNLYYTFAAVSQMSLSIVGK